MKEWTNLLKSNCHFQSGAKCNRPTFFLINFCGFDPALTNLTDTLQLVFETVYGDEKDWNTETRVCRTQSCWKVNLPCYIQSKFTCTKDMRCGTNLFVADTFVCSRVCRKFWWLYSICIDKMLVVEYHSLLQGKKKIKRKAYSKWIFK